MFYIYVLKSLKYGNRYVGSTENINKRLMEHNNGKCRYTSGRQPWKLIYFENFGTRNEVLLREKFLKSGQGRKFLDSILK
jgi:putative endonuclease